MLVFVLYYDEYYASGRVLGVFASVEAAKASDKIEAHSGGILDVWESRKDGSFAACLRADEPDELVEPKAFAEYVILPFEMVGA